MILLFFLFFFSLNYYVSFASTLNVLLSIFLLFFFIIFLFIILFIFFFFFISFFYLLFFYPLTTHAYAVLHVVFVIIIIIFFLLGTKLHQFISRPFELEFFLLGVFVQKDDLAMWCIRGLKICIIKKYAKRVFRKLFSRKLAIQTGKHFNLTYWWIIYLREFVTFVFKFSKLSNTRRVMNRKFMVLIAARKM